MTSEQIEATEKLDDEQIKAIAWIGHRSSSLIENLDEEAIDLIWDMDDAQIRKLLSAIE